MKKIPVLLTTLLVAGVVLATSAFTHPLAVRNGIVTDYSAGSSLTIRGSGLDQTYAIRSNQNLTQPNATSGLGIGARVTVFATCYGTGHNGGSGGAGATGQAAVSGRGQARHNGLANSEARGSEANSNNCVALFVLVRAPASAANGTSGTSGAAATGTTTGTAAATSSPAVTGTPTTGTGGTGTAMPTMTPTP
jgi:hypothetical protein